MVYQTGPFIFTKRSLLLDTRRFPGLWEGWQCDIRVNNSSQVELQFQLKLKGLFKLQHSPVMSRILQLVPVAKSFCAGGRSVIRASCQTPHTLHAAKRRSAIRRRKRPGNTRAFWRHAAIAAIGHGHHRDFPWFSPSCCWLWSFRVCSARTLSYLSIHYVVPPQL